MHSEADIKGVFGFLVDNIYVVFGEHFVGIPMVTNCAPSLADLFLYSYEAEFVQKLLCNYYGIITKTKTNKRQLGNMAQVSNLGLCRNIICNLFPFASFDIQGPMT
jgi:hypothetical protein